MKRSSTATISGEVAERAIRAIFEPLLSEIAARPLVKYISADQMDPPEREPDEMTSFDHMARTGGAYLLAEHFGNPDTTLIASERYISLVPTQDTKGVKYPDLLVAFDVDPEAYRDRNAYINSEQGKPPDFVLEVASRHTGEEDTG